MMRRTAAALLAVLCLATDGSAEVDLVGAVGRTVARIELDNRSSVSDREIQDLFLVAPGDGYDPNRVQRSLRLLGQKVGIRNVIVQGEEEGAGVALGLRVEPEPLVRSIDFSGNRAIKDKELSLRLRSQVDRPALAVFLELDSQAIRDAYAEEGFPNARVERLFEEARNPLWVNLRFVIDEGTPIRVTRVELGEEAEMDQGRTLALLGLDKGSRASQRALREGVRKMLETYRREGWAEARLAGRARFQTEGAGAVLIVPLVLGKPVDVRFEGMDEWPARSLQDAVRENYGEAVDGDWSARVARAIAGVLRSEGYRDAKVSGEVEGVDERIHVVFHVSTGPLVRAKQVDFLGNQSFPAKRLEGYLSILEGGWFRPPPFTDDGLERDLQVLRELYSSKGFLDARVRLEELKVSPDGEATVRIRVEEGNLYRYGRVSFTGSEVLADEEGRRLTGVSPGEIADPAAVDNGRVKLVAALNGRGYPDAWVDYEVRKNEASSTLDVAYTVEAGELRRMGKIVVSGNARTQTHVVERELSFHEGDVWSQQAVLLSRQRLFRLGFFQKVNIEPLAPEPGSDRRDVRVGVVEQNAGSVTFGGGYGTEEGIKGFFEIGHANLQGAGRDVRLRLDADKNDKNYSLSFREPWFLGYRNALTLRLLRQDLHRDAYDLTTWAFQANLEREVSDRIRASLLYSLESNHLRNVTDSTEVEDINNYVLSSIGPVVAYDSRDDPFNPKSGFQHAVQAEWALDALGSEVQYGRYQGFTSGFFTWRASTLALLARAGFANNFGKTADLPINKRFFLGGRTTVRGFEKDEVGPKDPVTGDPIGGDTMLNLRGELRFPLWKQLGGVLFWDAGNVWNRSVETVKWLDLRQGVGGGIRYITPIGPLSVDIGWKVDRRDDEAASVWNFTIGNVF